MSDLWESIYNATPSELEKTVTGFTDRIAELEAKVEALEGAARAVVKQSKQGADGAFWKKIDKLAALMEGEKDGL